MFLEVASSLQVKCFVRPNPTEVPTYPTYVGATGHRKGHFIGFYTSIKHALYLNQGRSCVAFSKTTCAQKALFLYKTLDVCFQKSSGHKAVNSGRTHTHLHWDSHKTSFSSEGLGDVSCVDWTGNDPMAGFFSFLLQVYSVQRGKPNA
jgi:hypothetical protein